MTHHAGGRARGHGHLSTGRLALWLLFWFLMSCLVLGTVVGMAGGGTGQ
jgi:hypothetical protein